MKTVPYNHPRVDRSHHTEGLGNRNAVVLNAPLLEEYYISRKRSISDFKTCCYSM
jgi:hypothetical protein